MGLQNEKDGVELLECSDREPQQQGYPAAGLPAGRGDGRGKPDIAGSTTFLTHFRSVRLQDR